MSFFSAVVDENDAVHAGGFLAPLTPALGVTVEEHLPLREGDTGGVDFGGSTLTVDVWQEDLTLVGAETRGVYTDGPGTGGAAITRHRHGSGTGWYISTRPDADGLAAIMTEVYADAGIAPAELPTGVEAIRRRGVDADYLVAINHGTDAVSLPTSGVNLLTQDDIRGMLVLQAGDVAVVREPHTAVGGGR